MQLCFGHDWKSTTRFVVTCAVVWVTFWGSAARAATASSWAGDLPAISDGRHLWTWAQDVDEKTELPRVSLFHADLSERPPKGPAWEAVVQLTGRLVTRGVAADDNTLYLFFDDGSIHVISLRKGLAEDHWYFSKRTAPSLPAGVSVRAAAAVDEQLWVLVRIESAAAVEAIDAASTPGDKVPVDDNQELFDLILGYPDGNDDASAAETGNETSEATAEQIVDVSSGELMPIEAPEVESFEPDASTRERFASSEAAESAQAPEESEPVELPTERLLVLDRNTWKSVDLPEDWSQKLPVELIRPVSGETRPTLVAQVPTTNGGTVARIVRPAEEGWTSVDLPVTDHQTDEPAPGGIVALRVEGQLLLATAVSRDEGFAAQVMAVRGDKLLHVATSEPADDTDLPSSGQWTAVPAETGVAFLAGERNLGKRLLSQVESFDEANQPVGPALTVVDLHSQTVLPNLAMEFEPANPIAEEADKMIFLGVLITSTVLLFTFWRRVPTADQLQLPPGVVLADTLRRLIAGLIDLTPGFLVGTLAFGLAWDELYARWPGQGRSITFGMMIPGLAAIGTIVGHTALFEIATQGRSLGKLLTGLRVATLEGAPPRAWQSLVRCLLKSFDLIAYLLLILPIISPYRQRLGDMVARTVVTMKAPPEDSPGGSSEPSTNQYDDDLEAGGR